MPRNSSLVATILFSYGLIGCGLLALGYPAPSSAAPAERFAVVAGPGTEVVFASRAPMESFEGRTGRAEGWLVFDPDSLAAPLELEVRVDLASLDTGIGKRNQHMRRNHLETETYPLAIFSGGTVADLSAPSIAVGDTVTLTLTGSLDLHGVARPQVCAIFVTRPAPNDLRVRAEFTVLLPDHDIKRPRFLVVKLAEDQRVSVSLRLRKES